MRRSRCLIVALVFAPTLQTGPALASSTPSLSSSPTRTSVLHGRAGSALPLGTGDVTQMALGAGARGLKDAAKLGGDNGRFVLNGHAGSPGAFTHSFVQKLRRAAGAQAGLSHPGRDVQFGVIRSVSARTVELSRPTEGRQSPGSRLLYSTAAENFLDHVSVPHSARLQLRNRQGQLYVQRATSLAGLHPGMAVLVAGTAVAGTLRARVISTLQGAVVHRLSPGIMNPGHTIAGRRPGMNDSVTANFGGTGDLKSSYSYSKDFDNTTIFDIGIVTIRLQHVNFVAGLAGMDYRWPFQFSAIPLEPLPYRIGRDGAAALDVTPQKRTDGGYTLNVTSGVDAGLKITIHIVLAGDYLFEPHVGFGVSLSTRNPAPMPGQSFRLNYDSCPTIPIVAVPVVNWGLVIRTCVALTLKGAPFQARVSASGADMQPTTINFDGDTPYFLHFTPRAQQVKLTFDSFNYATNWDVGLEPLIALNPFGVSWSLGALTLGTDIRRQWIGDPEKQRRDGIVPQDQPTKMEFQFAAPLVRDIGCPTWDSLSTEIANGANGEILHMECSSPTTVTFHYRVGIIRDVTLDASASPAPITFDGGGAGGLFRVERSVGALTLNGLTLSHGKDSTGGAIDSSGRLTIANSTLSSNTVDYAGGAIYSDQDSTLTITRSAFLRNSQTGGAGAGGAIVSQGTTTITNSTFAGNSARYGSAIASNVTTGPATLVLRASTLADNAGGGGALTIGIGANVAVESTIFANNSGGNCSVADARVEDKGYNLTDQNGNCRLTGSTDLVSTDPKLKALANNGGPTQTMALSDGSPAIGRVPKDQCAQTDQRGVTRPAPTKTACDIGAFESAAKGTSVQIPGPGQFPSVYVDVPPRPSSAGVLEARAGAGVGASFVVTYESREPGIGYVLYGPRCSSLTELGTQDAGAGTTQHTVTVTGDDMNLAAGAVAPGATYFFEVESVSSQGVEVDDNGGQCYTVTIPST